MAKGKKWVLRQHFDGFPQRSDIEIQEFDIPELQEGDLSMNKSTIADSWPWTIKVFPFNISSHPNKMKSVSEILIATEVLTVDPYMRGWAALSEIGSTMFGEIVGKVCESKDPSIKVGEYVQNYAGWVTHAVVKGNQAIRIPELPKDVPLTLTVGTLGMPGLTAYFGLTEVAHLKPNDTLLVNAAAGAVGSVVGQIGKIKGCKVIGSAGSDEKVKYLKEELGFDEAYNYKTVTPDKLDAELKKLAPDGIDVFFENVGGEASSIIYGNMRQNGRVAVCGSISNYNVIGAKPKVTEFIHLLVYKSVRVEGFNVMTYFPQRQEALKEMIGWFREGKLKYREHKFEGFDSMYDAFMALFTGKNIGKVVITL